MPVELFEQRYFHSGREAEVERLSESFADIADMLALASWYEDIEYDELDEEEKAYVDALNLEELLTEQLQCETVDIRLTKFILRRLTQLQSADSAEMILASIDKLYPVFVDVIAYLGNLKQITCSQRHEIGNRLLDLMDHSVASHLEYHRLHLLNLFASNPAWGNGERLIELLPKFSDHFTRRKLILALGKSEQDYWFRRYKTEWQQFSPWERRAFLHGASSLEGDERKNWYESIQGRLDPLEEAIVSWSRQNPIHI